MEAGPSGPSSGFLKIKKTKGQSDSSRLNVVMCLMCAVCVTAVVYTSWRESVLHGRLAVLEDRVARLEVKSVDNVDVLVERFRRQAESQLRRRVSRGLNSDTLEEYARSTRDASECACPAGKKTNIDNALWMLF